MPFTSTLVIRNRRPETRRTARSYFGDTNPKDSVSQMIDSESESESETPNDCDHILAFRAHLKQSMPNTVHDFDQNLRKRLESLATTYDSMHKTGSISTNQLSTEEAAGFTTGRQLTQAALRSQPGKARTPLPRRHATRRDSVVSGDELESVIDYVSSASIRLTQVAATPYLDQNRSPLQPHSLIASVTPPATGATPSLLLNLPAEHSRDTEDRTNEATALGLEAVISQAPTVPAASDRDNENDAMLHPQVPWTVDSAAGYTTHQQLLAFQSEQAGPTHTCMVLAIILGIGLVCSAAMYLGWGISTGDYPGGAQQAEYIAAIFGLPLGIVGFKHSGQCRCSIWGKTQSTSREMGDQHRD